MLSISPFQVSSRSQGRPESRLFISNLKLMFVRDLPQKKRLNVRFECFVWLLRRNMIKHPDTNGVWLIELQFFLRNKIIKQLLGKIYQKCSWNIFLFLQGGGCVFAGRQDCLCRNYFDCCKNVSNVVMCLHTVTPLSYCSVADRAGRMVEWCQ